jgi:hypothetical protein
MAVSQLGAEMSPLTEQVFIVRTEDKKKAHVTHRIFSTRELADAHVKDTPLAKGNKFRIIAREAHSGAVSKLRERKQ